MSTLLEQASLVLIPSGYAEDKVYSVIPSNGSGDMSFTRASNGTRINFDGLVENTPWNLLTYSEDFSNGAWLLTNMTVIANNAIAPNGTLTADKITATAATASIANFIIQSTVIYTLSVYVKSATGSNVAGKIGGQSSSGTFTSFTATNEWTLVTCSVLSLGGNRGSQIQIINSGDSLYVWGAQLVIGSTAKPYFPTTDRLNVPRLTYQNGGGGCPSLLLEPQRTNVYLYSSDFSNAAWLKSNCTQTPNFSTSVISGINATKIDFTTIGFLNQTTSFVGNTTASIYVIVKADTLTKFRLVEAFYFGNFVEYDLVNKTATGTGGFITDLGNGWFQCGLTKTYGVGQTAISYSINSISTIGSLLICGAQAEAGTYATSYIPTVASSATRIADACSKTGISSLIGQTEGTLFFDGIVNNIQNPTSNIINTNRTATTISTIALTKVKATNKIRFEQFLGNGTFVNIPLLSTNSFADGVRTKVAIRYKSGDFAMYINGNLEATNASNYTNIGVKTELYLNDVPTTFAYQESVSFNQVILFTALTNSELATLTTI